MEEINKEHNINETQIVFEGIDAFSLIIKNTKLEMIELVREGKVSEATANRILLDYEYNFFQKMVKVVAI